MTISSVNTWVFGDKLTYAQANSLDANTQAALDKRSGQTDTLQSVVTCTNQGRILPNYEIGADADHTYALSDGISVIDATTLTGHHTYTLSNTGAATGDSCVVLTGSTYNITVKNNGGTIIGVAGIAAGDANPAIRRAAHSSWIEFRHNGTDWIFYQSSTQLVASRRLRFTPDAYCSTARAASEYATLLTSDTFDVLTSTQVGYTPGRTIIKTVNTGTSKSYSYRQQLGADLLPQGQKLSSVVMTLTGAGAHGALPQQMPGIAVVGYTEPFGSSATLLLSTGFAVDASASTAAYQASHTITFTPDGNNYIDHSTFTYEFVFLGEGGANALANLTIDKTVFNFSIA